MIRKTILKKRPGIALIIAILIMAVMSLIAVTALNYSRIDLKISHHTRVEREAFYLADSGLEIAPKVVRSIIDAGSAPTIPGVTISPTLANVVMGYTTLPASSHSVYPTVINPDLQSYLGGNTYAATVDRSGTGFLAGSGVEFGAGSEGIGVGGAAGGIVIYYTLDAVGFAPDSARGHVDAYYRCVPGVPGGK